jgi:hypothetical protein
MIGQAIKKSQVRVERLRWLAPASIEAILALQDAF